MRPYMAAPSVQADMPDATETDPAPSTPPLAPRRRRLMFRAWHRGTKEADLMIGGFVARHIQAFSEAELDELEAVLELADVDLADWLSGRRPIPREVMTPMLARMAAECAGVGAGIRAQE
jgi:antitoxin CptB